MYACHILGKTVTSPVARNNKRGITSCTVFTSLNSATPILLKFTINNYFSFAVKWSSDAQMSPPCCSILLSGKFYPRIDFPVSSFHPFLGRSVFRILLSTCHRFLWFPAVVHFVHVNLPIICCFMVYVYRRHQSYRSIYHDKINNVRLYHANPTDLVNRNQF